VHDFQSLIFRSASHWTAATALVVFAVGLLYALQGFRFARFLIAASCTGGGLVLGAILSSLMGLPAVTAILVAGGLGTLALLRPRPGLAFASALTFAALAQYLAVRFGMKPNMVWIAAGVGAAFGFPLIWVCQRRLPILVTTLQGAGLVIVGFVGLASAIAPSLGLTFVDYAHRIPLMVPGLILMLCVLGYSVQANAQQGMMEAGGAPGWSYLEPS
jgi:drug/metabolite transporter (DMT)-like permease